MKTFIKIDTKPAKNKRAIFFNDESSHHVDENELQEAIKQAELGAWKSDGRAGRAIGSHLFQLLNGSGGHLRSLITDVFHTVEPLYLCFNIPLELDVLPIELLFHQSFLLLNEQIFIIRNVTDRNRLKNISPEKRMLKMLFLACSPIDLEHAMLQFEKEEELILKEVEKLPLDMRIEDSGSLAGLEEALIEANGYDIIHLTGHAGIEPER